MFSLSSGKYFDSTSQVGTLPTQVATPHHVQPPRNHTYLIVFTRPQVDFWLANMTGHKSVSPHCGRHP